MPPRQLRRDIEQYDEIINSTTKMDPILFCCLRDVHPSVCSVRLSIAAVAVRPSHPTPHDTALPQHDPVISGLHPQYAYGDVIQAECTTDKSFPPATISWTINDVPVSVERVRFVRVSDV